MCVLCIPPGSLGLYKQLSAVERADPRHPSCSNNFTYPAKPPESRLECLLALALSPALLYPISRSTLLVTHNLMVTHWYSTQMISETAPLLGGAPLIPTPYPLSSSHPPTAISHCPFCSVTSSPGVLAVSMQGFLLFLTVSLFWAEFERQSNVTVTGIEGELDTRSEVMLHISEILRRYPSVFFFQRIAILAPNSSEESEMKLYSICFCSRK